MNWFAYQREHANPLPIAVTAIENYGRMARLLKANVPVSVEMDIATKFTGDHEHGFDTIAEIPGTDPNLKDEVVMVGGHLDSWASGTGATDNGAGSVVAMEVMRILNALKIKPRRTIRIALWSGEEQGLFGSIGYAAQHFGAYPRSTAPDQISLPEFLRKPTGPLRLKPEQQKVSAYFNVDNGSGRIRGVYLQENAAVAPIFQQWIEPLKDLGVTTLSMRNTGGPTTSHSTRSAFQVSSSFRTRSTMVRVRTTPTWIRTSVCRRKTSRRPLRWRRSSYTTPPCVIRCCRAKRCHIRNLRKSVPRLSKE